MSGEVGTQIEFAAHFLALGIGYGFMALGGIVGFVVAAWWAFDAVAARLGWIRLFYRHSRVILAAERARRDEKEKHP